MLNVIGAMAAAIVGLALWFARGFLERRQKTNDILIGLHAEIIAGRYAARLLTDKKEEALQNDTPFATSDRTDFVFESIRTDISILPAIVIHDVVKYYRLAEQSNRMTDDLRDEAFTKQGEAERREFIEGLLSVADDQTMAARSALDAIERYAEVNLPSKIAEQLRRKRGEQLLGIDNGVKKDG